MSSIFVVTVTETLTEGKHPQFPQPFVVLADSPRLAKGRVCALLPDDIDAEVTAQLGIPVQM